MAIGFVLVVAFSCSLYRTADLGVAPYDAPFSLMMADRLPLPYFGCRVSTDALCAGHHISVGRSNWSGHTDLAFGLGPFVQFSAKISEKVLGIARKKAAGSVCRGGTPT